MIIQGITCTSMLSVFVKIKSSTPSGVRKHRKYVLCEKWPCVDTPNLWVAVPSLKVTAARKSLSIVMTVRFKDKLVN